MLDGIKLPELYDAASSLSDSYQRKFLLLVKLEIIALFFAALLGMDFDDTPAYFLMYGFVLLAGLVAMLVRSLSKPEQQWYRARAAAESMKTSSWRYMMRAYPFEQMSPPSAAQGMFLGYIVEIFRNNKVLAQSGRSEDVNELQITNEMEGVRAFPLIKRVGFYTENRVINQQRWYLKKAESNRKIFSRWIVASVTVYFMVIFLAFGRVALPRYGHIPAEPLIVLASSILGWTQIKKHSELAASYSLTAREIGLAKEEVTEVQTDEQFSDYVNVTELAFSREHTQWVARQETAGS